MIFQITKKRGKFNTIGVAPPGTRRSGEFYPVSVIILHGVFSVHTFNLAYTLNVTNSVVVLYGGGAGGGRLPPPDKLHSTLSVCLQLRHPRMVR